MARLTNINSNTIASVSLTGVTSSGTSTASPFIGILVTNGLANTNSNTIGSQGATGSLTFSTTTTTATEVYGIFNFSVDDWTANSNNVGGISVTNLGARGTFVLFGMRANTSDREGVQRHGEQRRRHGGELDPADRDGSGLAGHRNARRRNAISTWTSNTSAT